MTSFIFSSIAVVRMYIAPMAFQKQVKQKKSNLQKFLKPILISAVVLITLLMVLLLIASWDRDEHRIRGMNSSTWYSFAKANRNWLV